MTSPLMATFGLVVMDIAGDGVTRMEKRGGVGDGDNDLICDLVGNALAAAMIETV